jgi:hypothetical protein
MEKKDVIEKKKKKLIQKVEPIKHSEEAKELVEPINQIMTETNQKVQEITLEYLCNYNSNSHLHTNVKKKIITTDKNKKFYRKRIIQVTKDLLEVSSIEEKKTCYPPDIERSFQKYIESCIDHFQTIDRTDLLQEDYKNLEESLASLDTIFDSSNIDLEKSVFDANQQLIRSLHMKPNTLDGLVKRTVIKKEEPILPKKKKINLKDPELKNKGISKKDNLTNT